MFDSTIDSTIERILTLMSNDVQDPTIQSKTLEAFYDSFDEKTRASIDIIVTCICGYSLDTIINHPDEITIGDK